MIDHHQKVEQKKRERFKQIAAEKRLAQKFFLIQVFIKIIIMMLNRMMIILILNRMMKSNLLIKKILKIHQEIFSPGDG